MNFVNLEKFGFHLVIKETYNIYMSYMRSVDLNSCIESAQLLNSNSFYNFKLSNIFLSST